MHDLKFIRENPAAFDAAGGPVKQFMLSQVDQEDLALFVRLSRVQRPANLQELPIRVVTPAFMISELRRAFERVSHKALAEQLCVLDASLGLSVPRLIETRFQMLDGDAAPALPAPSVEEDVSIITTNPLS